MNVHSVSSAENEIPILINPALRTTNFLSSEEPRPKRLNKPCAKLTSNMFANHRKKRKGLIFMRFLMIISVILAMLIAHGCSTNTEESESYQPVALNDGWPISTPEEQGLDSRKLDEIYEDAQRFDHIYSLIIVRNGFLIAEKYFNGQGIFDAHSTASVTKSITSALTGIALRENHLTGLDQKMMEFFPEIGWQTLDPRKSDITIQQILQMRSGYPWEEFDGYLATLFSSSNWIPFIEQFPLMNDPGTEFGYSNFTAHMMGIIVARAANTSLRSFCQTYLFDHLGVTTPYWPVDSLGYYYGSGDVYLTPRNMAKFGQLFLDNGVFGTVQIIPSEWVSESLQIFSPSTYPGEILTNIHQLGYGYMWWSGVSGNHQYNFAWGHGGQLIMVIQDLNMVIVTSAAPQSIFDNAAWQKEKAIMELVGEFISRI